MSICHRIEGVSRPCSTAQNEPDVTGLEGWSKVRKAAQKCESKQIKRLKSFLPEVCARLRSCTSLRLSVFINLIKSQTLSLSHSGAVLSYFGEMHSQAVVNCFYSLSCLSHARGLWPKAVLGLLNPLSCYYKKNNEKWKWIIPSYRLFKKYGL